MSAARVLSVAFLLALASVAGCGDGDPAAEPGEAPRGPTEIGVGAAQDGGSTALRIGHVLRVELPASPETGYAWELVAVDEMVLRVPVEEYLPPEAEGEPGTSVWRFEAVGSGTTKVELRYLRFGDDVPVEERTFAFRVIVD